MEQTTIKDEKIHYMPRFPQNTKPKKKPLPKWIAWPLIFLAAGAMWAVILFMAAVIHVVGGG